MGKLRLLASSLQLQLVSIGLSIVIVVLLPIFILIWTPILIYRKIMSIVVPLFYPGVTKILTHRSTNFIVPDMYSHDENLIVSPAVFEGNVPLENLQRIFLDRIFQMKLPNGELRYPELKQCFFYCMGFYFWKNCDSFEISDHVKLYNKEEGQVVSEEEMNRIKEDLLNTPFKENSSPWLYLLIHNYISDDPTLRMKTNRPTSVILMKMHHALADGYSMQKLTMEGTFDPFVNEGTKNSNGKRNNVQRTPSKVNWFRVIWDTISFPVRSVNEFAQLALATVKKRPLHISPNNETLSVYGASPIIDVRRIKRIKNELGVAFTSVLFSICSGAISKLMIKKQMELPGKMPVVIPYPLPGHPKKLRNHLTSGAVYVPLCEKISARERLNNLNESYESLKRSTLPGTLSMIFFLVGGMFPRLAGPFRKGMVPPVLISSFPGADSRDFFISGHRMLELSVYCGLLNNVFGMGIYIMTKGDDLKLSAVGSTKIMNSGDVKSFVEFIEQEILLLEHEIFPQSVKVESN